MLAGVNGSEQAFKETKRPYELNSTLNDKDGKWIRSHGENRYRDWDELKYSVRSVEKYAPFMNKIQLLVNSLIAGEDAGEDAVVKQVPSVRNLPSPLHCPKENGLTCSSLCLVA